MARRCPSFRCRRRRRVRHTPRVRGSRRDPHRSRITWKTEFSATQDGGGFAISAWEAVPDDDHRGAAGQAHDYQSGAVLGQVGQHLPRQRERPSWITRDIHDSRRQPTGAANPLSYNLHRAVDHVERWLPPGRASSASPSRIRSSQIFSDSFRHPCPFVRIRGGGCCGSRSTTPAQTTPYAAARDQIAAAQPDDRIVDQGGVYAVLSGADLGAAQVATVVISPDDETPAAPTTDTH